MEPFAFNFLFLFLFLCIAVAFTFIFFHALLSWILSRILSASVGFCVGGCNSLRDVVVKFKKGPTESVSIGEIKLSLCHSSVEPGVDSRSWNPKLQLLICDLEVVTRPTNKSPANKSHAKKKTQKSKTRSLGKGKWKTIVNIARYFSFSLTGLVVKTPKSSVGIGKLNVDISKGGGPESNLLVSVQILPIVVHIGDPQVSRDLLLKFSGGGCSVSSQASVAPREKSSAPFICEKFSVSCEFGHYREVGIVIKNVDISCGEVTVNLNERLLVKRKRSSESPSVSDRSIGSNVDHTSTKPSLTKEEKLARYSSLFPEKVGFNLPKLNVSFEHCEYGLSVENYITGIQFNSIKSRSNKDIGESARLHIKLEFREIHLLREADASILEITKVNLVSFVYVPVQSISLLRAEIEIKLGRSQCNIILSRLKPWLLIHSSKKKKVVLREEASVAKPKSNDNKTITWTCKFSTPEMTIMLYNMAGFPVYRGCLQSPHLFAKNISNMGTSVHFELGEFNLQLADENKEFLKETIFGVESDFGSIIYITKVSLDWGKKDMKSSEEDGPRCMLGLSVDVTSMGIYLTFKRLESLISAAISFQALMKSISSKKKSTQSRGRSSKTSGKGTQMLKCSLVQCSVYILGETGLENTVVLDPKRVNYGSQGGRVIIDVSEDGTPRNAKIVSTVSDDYRKLKYCISLEIIQITLSVNKVKQSTQIELVTARSIYQEHVEENRPMTKVALFDMQNTKFVKRLGGVKENAACSLFSATDITMRWEPDVHLSLIELVLQTKLIVHNKKLEECGNEHVEDSSNVRNTNSKNEATTESRNLDKKKGSIFAVDVEMLNISAGLGDGVEAMVQVQSIFSENASIGVLFEGLMINFNGARILKSSRMQISRIPSISASASDAKGPAATTWDWVIQGLYVHICLPYRLELRAIDDALEDMLRALKLIVAAKTNLIFPVKKDSSKAKKPSSSKFGCIKFFLRKLTADIEEEPIQGWLDEHYKMLKKEAGELVVRLNFLDEFISKAKQDPKTSDDLNNSSKEGKLYFNDVEVDVNNSSIIESMREEIYKRSFRSYYEACQKIVFSEGSGACKDGFQAGFKPSASRSSLFSISVSDLDLSLTKIDGGDAGMIEFLRKLDPVCLECDIPFSRLYGANILLNMSSLVVQLRNYTFPLFAGSSGKCKGCLVLAQQATSFQPQILQDVYVGQWRKVCMLRSATGTTPPMKTFLDLPIHFQRGEVSFGVGYEPVLTDLSYAFTVVMRRANLSIRNPGPLILPPKKEKSLPWWDDMRNYIHGRTSLLFSETRFNILATTDPYENLDKLQIVTSSMEIHQSDGRILLSSKDFKIFLSSLESLANKRGSKIPAGVSGSFLEAPVFTVEVTMDWDCDSGKPLNHYLFALPIEGKSREIVFDPFRSTSLSLRWNISFGSGLPLSEKKHPSSTARDSIEGDVNVPHPLKICQDDSPASPTLKFGAYDLAWIIRFWNLNFLPPHKLRSFSRWPRFGVPRLIRSGNLSLDRVMTEFMLRLDCTPICIKNMPLHDDDPAKGLTLMMTKLKLELCFSRGSQHYTFESKRDLLDLVYQGIDLYMPKGFLIKEEYGNVAKSINVMPKNSQSASEEKTFSEKGYFTQKNNDDGFLFSCDYFTIRKQSAKADPDRLLAWHEAGRRNFEKTNVQSNCEKQSETDEHMESDPSGDDGYNVVIEDDGYNVVIADSCQRVFVYGLKILWTIENRNAICFWAGGLSKAFAPAKPSPSRQYAQRKLYENNNKQDGTETSQDEACETHQDDETETHRDGAETHKDEGVETNQDEVSKFLPTGNISDSPSSLAASTSEIPSFPSHSLKLDSLPSAKYENTDDSKEGTDLKEGTDSKEGTRHFMVNVIEPQFNLHSEGANGRFLLAAVSGRVLAQSFHSVLRVGHDMIEQALGTTDENTSQYEPEIAWKRMEISVMLEHVQAHVAPTDVDLGAGVQWLPKIIRGSPKVMRTGALLERVFMPCDMYFQFTRHKGGTPEVKVKPLKELKFNSHNITATMTSRQFQVMLDVLNNLLFARLPKPPKSSLTLSVEDDENDEEEADEVVPDGVEEVELAKINLEKKEREQNLLLDDMKKLSFWCDTSNGKEPEKEQDLWMIYGGIAMLVQGLKKELVSAKKSRKEAYASLRMAMKKAAQVRLMEKEKNKSPSYAMRVILQINKVVWSMILDGKSFAEAEINDMIYDFDRDYKDVGISQFTTKYIVFKNCLPNAKSDTIVSAWKPPDEWVNKVMLRVDARQGAPKDGSSPFELFQVDIYPLKIHLTETMYRMMWGYFFPEEERDSQRRQEVWKVSTAGGARRVKKGSSAHEASTSSNQSTKESEASSKSGISALLFPATNQPSGSTQTSKAQNVKIVPGAGSTPECEETVAESVADENGPFGSTEQKDEVSKNKSKDVKGVKAGQSSLEEKKVAKPQDDKRSRPKKIMEFHNIKISQVELCITYEGQRFVVNDMKLLMDQFVRAEFTGTWQRLFSRVKKHIIWGVLKSVTGMQGKKFKDKGQNQPIGAGAPEGEANLSDTEGHAGKPDKFSPSWPKRPTDGAGDGFVTSVRGIFNSQRRKAKKLLKPKKDEAENEGHGDLSENEVETTHFARQLTIIKAKKLFKRDNKKPPHSKGQKGSSSIQNEELPSSSKEAIAYDSDSSSGSSSSYELILE